MKDKKVESGKNENENKNKQTGKKLNNEGLGKVSGGKNSMLKYINRSINPATLNVLYGGPKPSTSNSCTTQPDTDCHLDFHTSNNDENNNS